MMGHHAGLGLGPKGKGMAKAGTVVQHDSLTLNILCLLIFVPQAACHHCTHAGSESRGHITHIINFYHVRAMCESAEH